LFWAVKVFYVLGTLLLFQCVWSLLDGIRFLRLLRRSRNTPARTYTPSAAVVIPCKGMDAGFEANLERFLSQDYPDYRVTFAVAAVDDEAYRYLHERLEKQAASGATLNPQTSLVVAGLSEERGEKVNNLIHAVGTIPEAAQVYVFADIDASPSPDWLRSLVLPLANPDVTVSTGFRWYLPGKGFASRLRAAWDTSIATMLGEHDRNFAWGGSMALRAADFRRLGIAEKYWQNTVSDDYAVTRAVRDAGAWWPRGRNPA